MPLSRCYYPCVDEDISVGTKLRRTLVRTLHVTLESVLGNSNRFNSNEQA